MIVYKGYFLKKPTKLLLFSDICKPETVNLSKTCCKTCILSIRWIVRGKNDRVTE